MIDLQVKCSGDDGEWLFIFHWWEYETEGTLVRLDKNHNYEYDDDDDEEEE